MAFITQPTKEGETRECDNCGMDLTARLTDYKGRFPDKIQWQSKNERKAHYDKDGNCKGIDDEAQEYPNGKAEPHPETQNIDLKPLDPSTRKTVSNEAEFICHIRKEVIATVKKHDVDPHPGMIWEMSALIWRKYFGAPEQ